MKKTLGVLLIATLIASCSNNDKKLPDVSGINVELTLDRFDRDFFAIDTNNPLPALNNLNEKYPGVTGIFLQNILGLDSASTITGVRQFLRLSKPIHDTINDVFKDAEFLEKDFRKAFRFVKYYYPKYQPPRHIVTVAGPVDALAQSGTTYTPNFLGPDFLGISMQFYLGSQFSVYADPYFVENVAPGFRSRRFSKEYIIADGMQLIVDDISPDKSKGLSLIEQMIEKGKQWWLLDQFLPETADSVKTGFRQDQLDWCKENEGLVWSYIVKNEDLYSRNPATIQTYIGDGPFTQGFSQEYSPGNIGQWIGWQIVQKFASRNSNFSAEQVMQTGAQQILDEAKYKPK